MKVIILAGGFGTRISEYTKKIPKPMIKIGSKPIIYHIMNHYSKYGFKEFFIALGYKGHIIKEYFKKIKNEWKINFIGTGLKTMTGGRLKRFKGIIKKNETFMMTYGDGLSNVNIKNLVKFHKKNKKIVTLTAVRPPARFGAIKIKRNTVKFFKEKSRLDEGWINGGFFVMEEKILKYIKNDKTYLEREPLQRLSKNKLISAYKHKGFWQCMDTERDKLLLEELIKKKKYKL